MVDTFCRYRYGDSVELVGFFMLKDFDYGGSIVIIIIFDGMNFNC